MKDINLKEQDIQLIGTDHGPIYFPFDDNEDRKVVHSKEISKNQLAFLYSNLYSAYLKLYLKNKTLEEELKNAVEADEEPAEVPTINESYDSKFEKYFNELIDKRIKEKLVLDERSEPYSGSYATLNYGEDNLGYVCLKAYHDD